jgi:hypothetical protein
LQKSRILTDFKINERSLRIFKRILGSIHHARKNEAICWREISEKN